ncbi:MAG: aminotransferase class V-fold PLP-dependent enzyme [Deltaproteobacteria bacterium]|nr:aminotransferase class V-fold PLP-dependent enzyme [Deltaproteobacteria bacterium]
MTPRFASHFDLGTAIWLNTAHQGALPSRAAAATRLAIEWKMRPAALTSDRFAAVPSRLRCALGELIGAPDDQIMLANSASYGLQVLAEAWPWQAGDEVLVSATDFPSDILPWLTLESRFGVRVRRVMPTGAVISPDELSEAITASTRLFCTSWVHSFTGHAVDLDALGEICRARGVTFVVNASQAIGARDLQVGDHPIDAMTSVGFKWLCGPYGTGFCWLSPEVLQRLRRTRAYWLSMLTADDLAGDLGELKIGPIQSAIDLDVFGTANFFNFTALAAAVELHLELGPAAISTHDQALVEALVAASEDHGLRLISPREPSFKRSTLVLVGHEDKARLHRLGQALLRADVHIAVRGGAIRFAPHLYNSIEQVELVRAVLADVPC